MRIYRAPSFGERLVMHVCRLNAHVLYAVVFALSNQTARMYGIE